LKGIGIRGQIEVLSRIFTRDIEENVTKNTTIAGAGVPAENRTENHPNMSMEHHRYAKE
jgi:hypothetical protein